VIANERRRQFAQALRRLSPDQQQVISLRLSGLSGAEIAAVLGKSPGAVRVIQHRAIKELRRLMGVRESGSADRTTTR
jgi:RNA polymerase sigma-70 factor (ECF subfamily)